MVINPYLNFNGNAEEALNFYKKVFGNDFAMVMRFKDTPQADQFPENEQDMIAHVSLPVGNSMLMASDVPSSMPKATFGSALSMMVNVDSREDADRIFNGLSDGAKIDMPLEDAFWGDYFGSLTDKFGIVWMVSFDPNSRKEQ